MVSVHEQEILHSNYGYDPNLAANLVGLVLFAVLLALQAGLGLWYRQWWFGVTWVCTSILEVLGYVARIRSHTDVDDFKMFTMQLVCLIIAPAFMAAGIYYQLAKIITVYGEKYSPVYPMMYSAIFTTCDVISLVVQAAGGGIAASRNRENSTNGAWIMVGGIAFQVASLVLFIIMLTIVLWRIHSEKNPQEEYDHRWNHIRQRFMFRHCFVPSICLSIMFVFIRSVYRVIELAEGWKGYLVTHEPYFLVLDGLMILLGMVVMTIIHPGFCLGSEVIPVKGLHYKVGEEAPPAGEDLRPTGSGAKSMDEYGSAEEGSGRRSLMGEKDHLP